MVRQKIILRWVGLFFITSLSRGIAADTNPKSLPVNAHFAKVVQECSVHGGSATHVYLVKQWHLGPEVDTRDSTKTFPQQKNQTAIYEQLSDWISNKQIQTVVAEGCEGTLTPNTPLEFNHWGIKELKAVKNEKKYAKILSSVPLKLEAKFGDSVQTLCGDDFKLMKDQLLAFSDARADLGFLTRLMQFKDDAGKAKVYLDGVIEAYKLPKDASASDAVAVLKKDLHRAIDEIKVALERRNDHVMEVVTQAKVQTPVLVYGGMHVAGLVKRFEAKGFACTVIEPVGYDVSEERVLEDLEKAMKAL